MAFNIGLSGLNAAAADLKITGHNIANVATTGFKGSRAEFGDIFTRSYGTIAKTNIGGGVRLISATQQFKQGVHEFTDNSMDLAIAGRGFFVMSGAGGSELTYTRAGAFQVDNEGFIVNNGSPALRLQGFPPTDPFDPKSTFRTGLRSDLKINMGDSPPNATAKIAAQINLRSDAPQLFEDDGVTAIEFDIDDPDTYNFSTSTTIYDSLGTPRGLTMYFVRGGETAPSDWKVHVQMDGAKEDVDPLEIDLTFDTNGLLIAPDPESLKLEFDLENFEPFNGATVGKDNPNKPDPGTAPDMPPTEPGDKIIMLDFTGTTQFGQRYAVTSLDQDGYTTGRITGVDADEVGVLYARYSNGRALPLGQVALADFSNPQGLQQIGDTSWSETTASGTPVVFSPGTGSLGTIQGGALETSNVDLAAQLVKLITAQRNYQANSQTISAANQVTQTILNIR